MTDLNLPRINPLPQPQAFTTKDGGLSTAGYQFLQSLLQGSNAGLTASNDLQSAVDSLNAATFTDFIPGFIQFVANQDYVIVNYCAVPLTVVSTVTWCTSGSCFATFKNNGTTIGGPVNTVTTTRQLLPHSSSAFDVGDYMTMTLSGNSNCRNMSFAVLYTRPLFT